jgi:3D (Asp-Asp-Asp) domain-containing protein
MGLARRLALTILVLAATTISALAVVPVAPTGNLGAFQITYYWFAPESDGQAQPVTAPGLTGSYREDFLYSAWGVPMEGTGTTLLGRHVQWAGADGAAAYWVNLQGSRTDPTAAGWTNGAPYWRNGGARSATGAVTFRRLDGSWSNGPAVKTLPYHDVFASGIGSPVTQWHSIATDPSVIPYGTRVYVAALAATPAKGCFVADDTGGAILQKHIDVLVPAHTTGLAGSGDVTALAPAAACPPPVYPRDLGRVVVRYTVAVRERQFAAQPVAARGLPTPAREDFLYGPRGVAATGLGVPLSGARRVVLVGGGYWVNAHGQRTTPLPAGGWTNGVAAWREGGWRSRTGRPTWRLARGGWAHGPGVRWLRYHERFALVGATTRAPWQTVGAPSDLAPIGSLVRIDALPSVGCLRVAFTLPTGSQTLDVVAADHTATATLPASSPATAYAPDDYAACSG